MNPIYNHRQSPHQDTQYNQNNDLGTNSNIQHITQIGIEELDCYFQFHSDLLSIPILKIEFLSLLKEGFDYKNYHS